MRMLFDTQLPIEFWGKAVKTVTYLWNCLLLRDKWGVKTSHELYKGFKLSVDHIHSFSCIIHTHILKEKCVKLENTFYKGIFLEYCKSNEHFRVWNPLKENVKIHTHIVFLKKEKEGQLLANLEQYDKNWDPSMNSDIVNDNYSSVMTLQKLTLRCNDHVRTSSSSFNTIEWVRENLKPSTRI